MIGMLTTLLLIINNLFSRRYPQRIVMNHQLSRCSGCLFNYNYSHWIVANTTLPRESGRMAIGYFNNTIYIFGGQYPNRRQFVEYHISSNTFNDKGVDTLPINVYGYNNQFYTQMNGILYWIDYNIKNNIIVYNLSNKYYADSITMYQYTNTAGCLTSNNEQLLFLSGGGNHGQYLKTVQIYNVSSQEWLLNVPSMQTGREDHGCVIDTYHNQLYVIGGQLNGSTILNSVETIFIDDIQSQHWEYTQNLKYPVYWASSSFYNNFILIIGGYSINGYINTVQIINCDTGQISIGGEILYAVGLSAGILVHDTQYIFGGYNGSLDLKTWQYLHLSHANHTTLHPTQFPTELPISTKNSSAEIIYIILGAFLAILICFVIMREWRKTYINEQHLGIRRESNVSTCSSMSSLINK